MKRQALTLTLLLLLVAGAAGGWFYYQNVLYTPEIDLEVVRIGVDVPYPPYSYLDDNGDLVGFEIDLGNATCKHLGIQCEWVITPWDDIIPGLQQGHYDAIMSSMSINAERSELVDFGEAYYTTPSVLFTHRDSGITSAGKSALSGQSVGVIANTIQEDYLRETYGDAIDIRTYETNAEVTAAMRDGDVTVVFNDYPQWEQEFMVEGEYPIIGKPQQLGKGVGMAFRKNDDDLRRLFDQGLAAMKSDGTYTRIRKDYLFFEIMVD